MTDADRVWEEWESLKDSRKPPFNIDDVMVVYLTYETIERRKKSGRDLMEPARRFWEFAATKHKEKGSGTAPLVVYSMCGGNVLDLTGPLAAIVMSGAELASETGKNLVDYVQFLQSLSSDLG